MPLSQGHARQSRSSAGLTRWYRLCTTRVFQGDCHECVPGYAAYPPVSTPFFPWHRDASWMPGASSRPRGVRMNRLRVFRRAHPTHLGRGVGQEQWLRVGPSAKYAARCVSLWDEMRTRTACCARAPQRCPRCLSTHLLLTFQEGRPLTNTRNPLADTWRVHLGNLTLPWVWPRRPGDV